ncbi:ribbon-helix-helix domain-containing protein [Helicobacter sp. L8]|uniref:ribbon-helix-helix domain-containing protein n=1 Tax=Helicobacter sp. L8 TaxID=2316078 RepID=UPI000EB2D266
MNENKNNNIPKTIQDALKNTNNAQENTFTAKDKAKPGRKPLPPHLKQNHTITFYLSQEEYNTLKALADQEADSVNFFVKRYVLKNLVKRNRLFCNKANSMLHRYIISDLLLVGKMLPICAIFWKENGWTNFLIVGRAGEQHDQAGIP